MTEPMPKHDPDGYTDLPAGRIAAIVTWLEMRAPPALPPVAAPAGVTIKPVPAPSVDWYRDLYRRVGSDWLWFSRLAMSKAGLAAILGDARVEVHAIRRSGEEIGLIELDRRKEGETELAFFGLVAEATGQGIGRWALARAIALAFDGGKKAPGRLFVHTCTHDHPAALGLYKNCGFVPYRRSVEIADDPRLTGLLPRSAAPHVPIV